MSDYTFYNMSYVVNKIRKLSTLFWSFSFLVSALAGCGKSDVIESRPGPMDTVQIPPEPTPSPETADVDILNGIPVIGDRKIVNGQMQSYLTGEWKDVSVAARRPIAVTVPNHTSALPHYGLSKASIIYEAPVEGRITRLMPVFEDFDDLERIGPVRGCRDYQIYVAAGYEAIFCNWGLAVPYVKELINSDVIDNVSAPAFGIDKPANEAYGRVSRSGYASEVTGYLLIDGVKKAVDYLKYDWNYSDSYVPQFIFAADNTRVEYADHPSATMIYPGGKERNPSGYGHYNPYFEYHEDDCLYYRYQDGNKMIDELNDQQYAVSNIVFQYCHGEVRDAKDYLAFEVHGEGDVLIFTNGKVVKGTWKRYDGDGTPAKYYDKNGNEIVINQGKTWICTIWKEYGEFVFYE